MERIDKSLLVCGNGKGLRGRKTPSPRQPRHPPRVIENRTRPGRQDCRRDTHSGYSGTRWKPWGLEANEGMGVPHPFGLKYPSASNAASRHGTGYPIGGSLVSPRGFRGATARLTKRCSIPIYSPAGWTPPPHSSVARPFQPGSSPWIPGILGGLVFHLWLWRRSDVRWKATGGMWEADRSIALSVTAPLDWTAAPSLSCFRWLPAEGPDWPMPGGT